MWASVLWPQFSDSDLRIADFSAGSANFLIMKMRLQAHFPNSLYFGQVS